MHAAKKKNHPDIRYIEKFQKQRQATVITGNKNIRNKAKTLLTSKKRPEKYHKKRGAISYTDVKNEQITSIFCLQ